MSTSKLIKVNFATSRPLVRYRYEDEAWQDSNVFLVSSGLTSYTFHAEDDKACKASITLTEDEIDFPLGNGVITIEKAITGAVAADEDVMFQFTLEHSQITITNLLVSVNSPRTIEGLPDGDFTITESPPPTGYLHTNAPVIVTLSEGDRIKSTLFTNEIDGDPVPTGDGTITINKRIINEEATDLDVIFTGNLTGPIVKYGIEFSINTPAVIADLPDGTYELEEIGLPDGYNFHGISPGAVVIAGAGAHTFDVLNSSGDQFFGDGTLEIQKRIFDEAGVEILDSDVLFSSVLLYDVIEIDGLKFSVNTPLELINLPFGEYKLYEDEATYGYNLDSILPWPILLSESAPDGTFVVKNIAYDTPEFREDLTYHVDRSGRRVIKTENISGTWTLTADYVFPLDADLPGMDQLLSNNADQYVAVLKNTDVVVGASTSGFSSNLWDGLWLFDKDLNLKKFLKLDRTDDPNTPASPFLAIDENDNIYKPFAFNNTIGRVVRKYTPDLETLLWESTPASRENLRGFNVTRRFVIEGIVVAFGDAFIRWTDRETGERIKSDLFDDDSGFIVVENFLNGDFYVVSQAGSGEVWYRRYDQDGNILLEYNPHPDFTILNRPKSAGAMQSERHLLSNNQNIRILDQDGLLIQSVTLTPYGLGKAGWADPVDLVYSMNFNSTSGAGNIRYLRPSTGENGLLFTYLGDIRSQYAFGMVSENWQLTPGPPPPTGDSTIYINKVVTEGDAADDDVYFSVAIEVNLGYRTHVFSGQVSVNDPLVLSNMPAGSYTIRESFDPNFELVGISPATFVLGSGSSQTVDITNKKLDTPVDSGKIFIVKRIINSISTDGDLVFNVDVIDDATSGVKATFFLKQDKMVGGSFPPGSYTLVETNSHAGIDHVSIIPNPVTVVADTSVNVEVTNERTAVSATAQLIINQTFDTLNPALQADAAFQITQNANWPPDGSGTPEVEVRDANDPSKLILITYNEFDSANDIAIKVMNAINGFTWNIPITATNPQPGAFKITANVAGTAGNNECFVITYGSHIDINGDGSGQFTQCLTGGQSGDLREVTIQYPYHPSVLAPPSVTVVWFPGETPAQVAARIETAINLNSTIKITASASANVVTFTEKRIGAEHIGKEIRVFYNPNTIDITPDSGILVMG